MPYMLSGRPSSELKERQLQDWEAYESGLGNKQTLVISSDIIESYFGKYRQKTIGGRKK